MNLFNQWIAGDWGLNGSIFFLTKNTRKNEPTSGEGFYPNSGRGKLSQLWEKINQTKIPLEKRDKWLTRKGEKGLPFPIMRFGCQFLGVSKNSKMDSTLMCDVLVFCFSNVVSSGFFGTKKTKSCIKLDFIIYLLVSTPFWKRCSSNWIISPGFRGKKSKNIWSFTP